ncbi:MAG TPA: hypothetical protein VEA41_20105 [Salinarimonas sp.]|nr:hypothetical protein [Salinarimonas sp.]
MAIAVFSAGAPGSGNGLITEDQLNDLMLAERAFALALADSADLFDSPAIYVTDGSQSGSLVQRHRQLLLGWGLSMDATAAEDTDVSASSVTAYDSDVTIARRSLRLDETGLARAVGGAWGFDPIAVGMTMVGSFRAGRMGALGTAIAAASTNITSAGTGSVDDLIDTVDSFTTSVGDPGLLIGMFHPFTLQSIRDSLRSEVGPMKERADIQAFLARGAEYLFGVLCFSSTKVTNAASKHENAVMAPGAIAYSVAMPATPLGGNHIVARPTDMPLLIELERDASRDVLQIVAHAYDGLAIREQARIRGLLGATS